MIKLHHKRESFDVILKTKLFVRVCECVCVSVCQETHVTFNVETVFLE